MKTGTVVNNKNKWQGHPDVALFHSGVGLDHLYVAYRESEHHKTNENTSIKIVSALSNDTIKFNKPITIFESGCEGRYNCPRLSVVNDKLYCVVDYVRNDKTNFIAAENTEENTEVHIAVTKDGVNWFSYTQLGITGIVPDRLMSFNGNYIIASHMARPSVARHLDGRLVQDVWINSSDDPCFNNWEKCLLAGGMNFNLCEASIFPVGGGVLGAVMRENSQQGLPAYFCFSKDSGRTWSKFKPTRLFGAHRPVMGKLNSGRYLVTYREQSSCFAVKSWARNTFSALIEPDDKGFPNFKVANILPLDHDRSRKPDGGYTGWVQLSDDSIFVVNYITDDSPKPYIKWYRLSEKDFCNESLEGDFF